MESDKEGRSDIKFGSYDTDRIEEGFDLSLIQTVNKTTWAVQGKDFKIGSGVKEFDRDTDTTTTDEGAKSILSGTR